MDKPLFASPQDCEAAFYEALETADLEAMMSVWAEDEEIICIHPTGGRLAGHEQVRAGWRQIFTGGRRMQVQLSNQVYMQGMMLSIHSVYESVSAPGEARRRNPVVATNVYLRTGSGWRMVAHHASIAPEAPQKPAETPKVLH